MVEIDTFDSLIGFQRPLYVSDKASINVAVDLIGDWAKACIYLGKWAKSQYKKETRRITFLVLPSREIATAFISLGALISSIGSYKGGLSWGKFSTLDSGVEIYWKRLESGDLFIGKVVGVELIASESAIKLEITKSRKAKDVGTTILIPEGQFSKFQFSLEKPASAQRNAFINASIAFMEHLLGNVSPAWAKSDGQDLLLVTNMNKFKSSIEFLLAGVGDQYERPIKFETLLGFEKLGDGRHSKMKISHPKGDLESSAELVILDGPSAFSIKEHIPLGNDLLIVFDSLEFNENELEFVHGLELAAETVNFIVDSSHTVEEKFPIGFEISSYSFPR
jgi:hypothetical protein